jgi:hypothetical protein
VLLVIGGTAAYLYWESMKTTPQYSLALLIDAARNDDQAATDQLVDVGAVVDDFMPQITSKAIELYGRGLPGETVARFAEIASPLIPAVKERARAELPKVIRKRTDKFRSIPFAAMVMGADRYLDIAIDHDTATVRSTNADRPFQVTMQRRGERWQIVGFKDDELSTRIAQKVGQEIVAVAAKGNINAAGERLGVKNLGDILKQAEEVIK